MYSNISEGVILVLSTSAGYWYIRYYYSVEKNK
eukprot:SAG11_NODE_1899_length_4091_cov_2.581914_1_plen_33_part_00